MIKCKFISACQNFDCYNGGTPETKEVNGEKTCVCSCLPGISGDHCEETKGKRTIHCFVP